MPTRIRLSFFHRMTRTFLRPFVAIACAVFSASCTTANPYFDASRPHHRPAGFQNNAGESSTKSLSELMCWQFAALRQGLPKPPRVPTPQVTPDRVFIAADAGAGSAMQPAITWVGHATMLAQIGGLNLITDPVFSQRASLFSFRGPKRQQAPGLALGELPLIDVVLISHNHCDHLDDVADGEAAALQPERTSRAGAEPASVELRSPNRARNLMWPKFAAGAPAARARAGT